MSKSVIPYMCINLFLSIAYSDAKVNLESSGHGPHLNPQTGRTVLVKRAADAVEWKTDDQDSDITMPSQEDSRKRAMKREKGLTIGRQ